MTCKAAGRPLGMVSIIGLLLFPALLSGMGQPPTEPVDESDFSLEHFVSDLRGKNRSDRKYAARVLRNRLRAADRSVRHARPGSLRYDEGAAIIEDFTLQVAPACVASLQQRNVAAICADILGILQVDSARQPLEALAADAPSGRIHRRAARALARLGPAE